MIPLYFRTRLNFFDKVSIDNRGIFRNKGYSLKGEKSVVSGEYARLPRVLLLCFIGVHGLLETYQTEGTFSRHLYFKCIDDFVRNSGNCSIYPGKRLILIMDGARIHCDKSITYHLRSLGVVPIFLPAYCPFYNPIELLFGVLKSRLK